MSSYDKSVPDASGMGNPIVKPEHLPKKGKVKAKATGNVRPYSGDFGDGWFVEVRLAGELRDLRVKADSGNHGRLKAIGASSKALKGKTLELTIKEFKGNKYVAIV